MLVIYEIVVVGFLLIDKKNQIRFFEETFLAANIGLEVVFKILFITLSNVDIDFVD